jgi:hypothetical protein
VTVCCVTYWFSLVQIVCFISSQKILLAHTKLVYSLGLYSAAVCLHTVVGLCLHGYLHVGQLETLHVTDLICYAICRPGLCDLLVVIDCWAVWPTGGHWLLGCVTYWWSLTAGLCDLLVVIDCWAVWPTSVHTLLGCVTYWWSLTAGLCDLLVVNDCWAVWPTGGHWLLGCVIY